MAKKLILIDDHYWFRSGVADTIQKNSQWQVAYQASSEQEAEAIMQELAEHGKTGADVYIALVDLSFRDSADRKERDSGFDIVQKFRHTVSSVKCIVFSSHESSDYVNKAMQAGALGYVSKNSSSDTLVKALDTVADGKTFIQQELLSDFIALKEIYSALTKRERMVVELLTPEITNKDIAEAMGKD